MPATNEARDLIAGAFEDLRVTALASIGECAKAYLDAGLPKDNLLQFLEPFIQRWARQFELTAAQFERVLERPRMH